MEMDALLHLLDEVGRDERTGATELLLVAADALREWGRGGSGTTDAEIRALVRRLATLRPSMAPFLNLADAVAGAVVAAGEGPARSAAGEAAADFGRRVAVAPRKIASQVLGSDEIRETSIATYSAGASVRAALLALHHAGRPVRVFVSEARPALEGAALAEALGRAGLAVTLVTDAALFAQLPGVQAVWLGADALVPEGLIHKVGTASLAREARRAGAVVRTLAGRSKWIGRDLADRLQLEAGDPAAVHPGGAGLQVANPLFDLTPWQCLDTVASEDGCVPAEQGRRALGSLPASPALVRFLDL